MFPSSLARPLYPLTLFQNQLGRVQCSPLPPPPTPPPILTKISIRLTFYMFLYSKVTTTLELQTWNHMNKHSRVAPTHLQVNRFFKATCRSLLSSNVFLCCKDVGQIMMMSILSQSFWCCIKLGGFGIFCSFRHYVPHFFQFFLAIFAFQEILSLFQVYLVAAKTLLTPINDNIVLQKKKKILIISPFCLSIVTGMKILVCYFRLEIGPRKTLTLSLRILPKIFKELTKIPEDKGIQWPLKDLNQMFKDLSVGDGDDDVRLLLMILNSSLFSSYTNMCRPNVVSLIL